MKNVDVCIIGGGMIGAASAIGCAKQGLSVCLIEAHMPQTFEPQQDPDLRVSAINLHSVNLLQSLGAWQHIENMRYRPYLGLECWESPQARTSFYAQDVKQSIMGYFVENRIVQLALLEELSLSHADGVSILTNVNAKHVDCENGQVSLDDGTQIRASIIIAADGANSRSRTMAGIGSTGWGYKQRANVFSVRLKNIGPDITWQQFTPTGPMALLPMYQDYASLVWYADQSFSANLAQMSDDTLKQCIQNAFPDELDEFELIDRGSFPLTRSHANRYYRSRLVLLGDAAHSINPLAGQGVNLGFKDLSALLDALADKGLHEYTSVFEQYTRSRRMQNLTVMSFMDAIYLSFSNKVLPLQIMRNLALMVADKAGLAKQIALKHAMGL
ncbi:FAD-dependent oxidoreductase [Agaribacter flavus]|uniref:FAD-dependent oxidoreductase n=1 Tax=Agaribacter flavus TaxID=1902781 RepID=A0ABV7FL78_9ALTE